MRMTSFVLTTIITVLSSRISGGASFFDASCWDFSISNSLFAVNGVSLTTTVQPLLHILCFPKCAPLLPSKHTPRRYLGKWAGMLLILPHASQLIAWA
eukprot:g19414.t1